MSRTCYECKHCVSWTEYGEFFTDCKLSETDRAHADMCEFLGDGRTDQSRIGEICPRYDELDGCGPSPASVPWERIR